MTQARVKDSVLILGNYRPTLAVARALGEEGHHVIVSEDDDRVAGARYSRFVDEMWDHPGLDAEAGATFKQALKLYLDQRPDITAIVPVAEEFVVWLAKNGTSLPADITIVIGPDHVLTGNVAVTSCFAKFLPIFRLIHAQ